MFRLFTTLFGLAALCLVFVAGASDPPEVGDLHLAAITGGSEPDGPPTAKIGTDLLDDATQATNSCFTGCYSAGGHGFTCQDISKRLIPFQGHNSYTSAPSVRCDPLFIYNVADCSDAGHRHNECGQSKPVFIDP